jgi:hypothetical protein
MLGSAVAPSTVNFSQFRRMEGPRCKCMISDLLSAFCGSLEEQIKCRRFFYKSATLIRGTLGLFAAPVLRQT